MPQLDATVRRYLTDTARTRLASPGIERYRSDRSRASRNLALGAAFALALVGLLLWLATRM